MKCCNHRQSGDRLGYKETTRDGVERQTEREGERGREKKQLYTQTRKQASKHAYDRRLITIETRWRTGLCGKSTKKDTLMR